MKWSIIFHATFLMLSHRAICITQGQYRNWMPVVQNSVLNEGITKKTYMSDTKPDYYGIASEIIPDQLPSAPHKPRNITIGYTFAVPINLPIKTKQSTKRLSETTNTYFGNYYYYNRHKAVDPTLENILEALNNLSTSLTTMPTKTKLTTKTTTEPIYSYFSDNYHGDRHIPIDIIFEYIFQVLNILPTSTITVPTGTTLTTKTATEPINSYFSDNYHSDRNKHLDTTLEYILQGLSNLFAYTTIISTRTKLSIKTTTEPTTKSTTIESKKESTIKLTTTTTTQSITEGTTKTTQDFLKCVLSCPVTSEYNPVCGTNSVTYSNQGRLNCAKRCGLALDLLMASPCPSNTIQIFLSSQSPSASTISKTNFIPTSEMLLQQRCISLCDRSLEWQPVCGSNDITYNNAQDLICAQYCGVDVRLKKFSACTYTSLEQTTPIISKSIETVIDLVSSLTVPPSTQFCVKGCPVSSEHNPVCGTNDVTYKNPSFLQCLITCGMNIQMKHRQACSQKNNIHIETSVVSQPQSLTTPSKTDQNICIDVCNTDLEYYPVCGSNNVTYRNLERLQCAVSCNVDVSLETFSPCPESSSVSQIAITEHPENLLTTSITNAQVISKEPINVAIDLETLREIFDIPNITESYNKNEIKPRFKYNT